MVDLEESVKKLPPEERLKRARELEAEKRRLLEEELKRREAELEELKEETKRALEAAKELEEESLEELSNAELEERIAAFKKEKGFLLAEESKEASDGPAGFGQVNQLYQSDAFKQAEEHLDYLLHAENPSQSAIEERSRALYQNVRELSQQFNPNESYAFNKMQEQLYELKRRDEVQNPYVARTNRLLNEMTDIIDYRREDEERRRRAA